MSKPCINFSQTFKTISGGILKDSEDEPLTLRALSVRLLLLLVEADSGDEKAWRYTTALKIQQSGDEPLEMKPTDVAKLKAIIGKHGSPLVVGQTYEMLGEND